MSFGENVETGRGLAEEHYLTHGQQVKSSLERAFEPLRTLRNRRNFAEIYNMPSTRGRNSVSSGQ